MVGIPYIMKGPDTLILNLTGETIRLYSMDRPGHFILANTLHAEVDAAWVRAEPVHAGFIGDAVDLDAIMVWRMNTTISNLPDPRDGVVLVVTPAVIEAVRQHGRTLTDLYTPTLPILDSAGHPYGYLGLRTHDA